MSDPIELIPHRYQPHFCRKCGHYFREKNLDGTTPHAQVWQHRIHLHGGDIREYVSCSRNCTDREQSEERRIGKRLYGAYVPLTAPPLGRRYEDVMQHEDE